MYQNLYQNWDGLYQAFQKPVQELADLNLKAMSDFTKKNENIDSFINAKSPEDLLKAQMNLLTETNQQAMAYFQKLIDITQKNTQEFTKKFSDITKENMQKTADFKKKQ